MKTITENKKALSPVIATIILVSITIVVAISVAYWMGSLAGTYTRFEKVEITYAYSTKVVLGEGGLAGPGWNVTCFVKNTGSADATIDNAFINAKPFAAYNHVVVKYNSTYYPASGDLSVAIMPGGSTTVNLLLLEGPDVGLVFSAGSTLDVKFHTASGKEYPKIIELV